MILKSLSALLGVVSLTRATFTVTVTSRNSACTASFPISPYVTTATTTNAAGSTFVTIFTVSEPRRSVSKYTTTNSRGSTIVTSTTLTHQHATTSGSTSASSASSDTSTVISIASSSITSLAPSASPSAPCPQAAFAQNFVASSGVDWQIFCSADAYYYNLPSLATETFEQCINACDAYQPSGSYGNYPCVAVSWTTPDGFNNSNCLLKYGVDQVVYGTANYCSAKLASYVLPPNFPVSIVSKSATSNIASASAPVSTSYSFATGTQVSSYQTPSPCPYANQSTFTVPDGTGVSYEILCGISLEYDDLPGINVGSFEDCMAACNAYVPAPAGEPYDQPCVAITYIGENDQLPSCFRHYALSQHYKANDTPYGDSAIRQNPPGRKRSAWQSTSDQEIKLDAGKFEIDDFLQAREQLAMQGISLVLSG